ncbi:MAG: hypothetical protein KTR25_13500 [Myxococcales bacterium]|nr:hypothetical protein [Myxococcales bacterium]
MDERFDALYASFERLSSRDQSLLLLTIVLMFASLIGFSSYLVSRSITRQERRIEAKLTRLRHIHELRADYQARLRQQKRLTNEIRSNNRTRILSHVERIAKAASIDLKNASERPGQPTGSPEVREEVAKVSVESVSLDRLNDFLKRLDQSSRLVVVRGVRISPNYEKPKRLNATITISTFKMAGGSS